MVKFYTINNMATGETIRFPLGEGEKLLDKLEEVLYIWEETEPVEKEGWKTELTLYGITLFDKYELLYGWGENSEFELQERAWH